MNQIRTSMFTFSKITFSIFWFSVLTSSLFNMANAAEADNFSGRFTEIAALPDSAPNLDDFVNQQLDAAIRQANASADCSARTLYLSIWQRLARNPISQTEKFAERSPEVKKYLVDFRPGIYGSVPTFLDTFRQPRFADFFILSGWFTATIRLHGQIIGIDKLGHFFGQGWDYFEKGNLHDALYQGIKDETELDGLIGSGVFSYADLAANRDGLSFWRQVLGGNNPYVSCVQKKFVARRIFSFSDYISSSWDEAQNCSTYVNKEFENSVNDRIKKIGLSCPISPATCAKMVEAPCANLIISPSCFTDAKVLEQKSRECESYAKQDQWNITPTGMTEADLSYMNRDKLLGILAMPWHFIWRDLTE